MGLNKKKKKQRESTFEIHLKVATVSRVRRTTVYNCVKSKSYRINSKLNIYKPKKIGEFSHGLGKVEQYQ